MQWHRGRRRTFRGSSLSPLAAGIRSRYGFKCVTPARGSVAILGSPWKSVNLSSHRDAEQQHKLTLRSEEHTLTPVTNAHLVCRLLLEKKKHSIDHNIYLNSPNIQLRHTDILTHPHLFPHLHLTLSIL